MIDNIRLQQFRSYVDEAFEFGAGVNIIVGPNASGKTNLLEALLVTSLGGSYRTAVKGLVQFDKPWARLDVDTSNGKRILKLEANEPITKRTYEISGQTFKRLPLNKTIPVVLFEPEHLRLLGGSPQRRRDYLDDLLEQTIPTYTRLRNSYKRTLTQRNTLLKRGAAIGSSQLFAWNIRLSELGGQMAAARHGLTEQINAQLGTIYAKLSGSKLSVSISYDSIHPEASYSSHLLQKLESDPGLEYLRGFTVHGPHRDDLSILVGGRPASDVASRGEVRTLLLCLKVVELRLLEEVRGQKPLLLLDDVFSELDGKRRQALTKFLKDHQTFITTTDADVVVQHFMENCTIIPTSKSR
jgi:DNA replication and repair protein RecF